MLNHAQPPIHLLMSKILTQQDNCSLDAYRNPKFCYALKVVAFDNMLEILYSLQGKINIIQLGAPYNSLSLSSLINTPHPSTGLNLLDYALISGSKDAFQYLIYCGARSDKFDILSSKMSYMKQCGDEIISIIEIMSDLISDYEDIKKQEENANDLLQLNVIDEQKFPKIWLGIGIACTLLSPVVYPLAHGAGSVLFLSMGLPSIFSGINSLQNATENQQRREQAKFHDILNQAIESIKTLKKTIKGELDSLRNTRSFVQPMVKPMFAIQDAPKSVLFHSHSSDAALPTINKISKNGMYMQ